MARSVFTVRFVVGIGCAASLYLSALLIAACTDVARNATEPRSKVGAHGPRLDGSGCNEFAVCDCDDVDDLDCDDDGSGGGDDGGDYIDDSGDPNPCSSGSLETHCNTEQPLDTAQKRMMDSVWAHTDTNNCSWARTYINSLPRSGANGSNPNTGFFGTATDWSHSTNATADTHYSNQFGTGPDNTARMHVKPTTFGNVAGLTSAVIHEAAHGYWGIDDPRDSTTGLPISRSDPRYSAPGTPQGWADACYKP